MNLWRALFDDSEIHLQMGMDQVNKIVNKQEVTRHTPTHAYPSF
jgi:hypothetical protein